MSGGTDDEGPGLVTAVFISGVLLFFVASAFAPLMDFASISPSARDLSLGDAVATRQGAGRAGKLDNYRSKFDALSPKRVQQKLRNLPVFYLSVDDGSGRAVLGEKIFMSYDQAAEAAKDGSSSGTSVGVKATTLDRVLYPLILKREGAAQSNDVPLEIREAGSAPSGPTYRLVPSAASMADATAVSLKEGTDIPLYVAERLAFASDDSGARVPLFAERGDAVSSYARLRESGGNQLPEEPTIKTTTLSDVLASMEGGTRPGVSQLEFYGNADDALRADKMMSSR
ncbi:hypothetical protein ACHAWF_016157 [Thalassiosira exigua]